MKRSSVAICEEILSTIERLFGIRTHTYQENQLGYLNLKWRLETDRGPVFVKQYNRQRYPDDKLAELATALAHQRYLRERGIPCPAVYPRRDRLIHLTPSGERFVLLEFCNGELVSPGLVSEAQMESLGYETGKMHRLLSERSTRRPAMHWDVPPRTELLADWQRRWEQAAADEAADVLPALERQREILEAFDFASLQTSEPGWAHWDLWVDNLLFHPASVAAVLDFDRMRWVYPEMDIARAVLSGALQGDTMRMEAMSAFVAGYRTAAGWEEGRLIRSLQLLWCLERGHVRSFEPDETRPVRRFRDEMIWLGRHWDRLTEMFSDI